MNLLIKLCILGSLLGLCLPAHHRVSHRIHYGPYNKHYSGSKQAESEESPQFKQNFSDKISKTPKCGVVPKVKHQISHKYKPAVSFGQIPWQAGIFFTKDDSFICSGTLVSPKHVVTSAFCVMSIEDHGGLTVRLGDWDISQRESLYEAYEHVTVNVAGVTMLPVGIGLDEMDMDLSDVPGFPTVALLKLKESVDFEKYPQITPICLPSTKRKNSHKNNVDSHLKLSGQRNAWKSTFEECFVSGWGYQNTEQAGYDDVQDANSESIRHSARNPSALDDFEYDDNRPLMGRSLSISPAMKSSEPFSVSIPILSDPEQKAIYEASGPSKDLYNSAEMFGEKSTTTTQPPTIDQEQSQSKEDRFDIMSAIDPLNHPEEMKPLGSIRRPTGEIVTNKPLQAERIRISKTSDKQPNSASVTDKPGKQALKREETEDQSSSNPLDGELVFRHKQKYKSAKQESFGEIYPEPEDDQNSQSGNIYLQQTQQQWVDPFDVNMAAPLNLTEFLFPSIGNSLYEEPPKIQYVLKSAKVQFQAKCTEYSPIGKGCVVPADVDTDVSLCMADLGSGITCNEGRKEITDNTSSTGRRRKLKYHEEPIATRAVLAGVVTWKRPCYLNDPDPSANVTIVTGIHEFLPALLEIITTEQPN